jgi:hypothetical protein
MPIAIEQLRNEFKIWRVNDEFTLNRTIQELVPASDLIELSEQIDRQVIQMEIELKNLKEKKLQFDSWINTAKEIREQQLKEGMKRMKEYTYNEKT